MVAPTAAYYAHGIATEDSLGGWMGGSFLPGLFTEGWLYAVWVDTIRRAVALPLVALAALAVVILPGRRPRVLLVALATGYLAFSVAFNYRTATHDYYHLPLVALVALALGLGAQAIVGRLQATGIDPQMRRAALGTASVVLALVALVGAAGPNPLEPRVQGPTGMVEGSRQIGRLTGHSDKVVGLTAAYGAELGYYGEVVAFEYPSAADARLMEAAGTPVGRPEEIIEQSGAEWFAVTNMAALDADPQIRAELRAHHRLVAGGEGWQLWKLSSGR